MLTSQILKSADFTKTQNSKYLENETFFLEIKKFINYTLRATFLQKNCSGGNLLLIFHWLKCQNLKLVSIFMSNFWLASFSVISPHREWLVLGLEWVN